MKRIMANWSRNRGIIRFLSLVLGFVLLVTKDPLLALLGGTLLVLALVEPLFGETLQQRWQDKLSDDQPTSLALVTTNELLNFEQIHWKKLDLAEIEALSGSDLAFIDLSLADLRGFDFRGKNLFRARLFAANLSDADLTGANLFGADLTSAWFINAKLHGADLTEAQLAGAYFFRADLRRANLSRANLALANFYEVELAETGFQGSLMAGTAFSGVDLRSVTGLRTVEHRGPSTLSIDTLARSLPEIPSEFLLGTGIAPEIIEPLFSWQHHDGTKEQPPLYTCFISYSHRDVSFARSLYQQLQNRGVRCWMDEEGIAAGDDINAAIDRGLRQSDKLLLCCSQSSLNSRWVRMEIEYAFAKEEQLRSRDNIQTVLIPLNLDNYLFSSAVEDPLLVAVKSRMAVDFRGWEHNPERLRAGVERLFAALKARPEDRGVGGN